MLKQVPGLRDWGLIEPAHAPCSFRWWVFDKSSSYPENGSLGNDGVIGLKASRRRLDNRQHLIGHDTDSGPRTGARIG